MGEGIEKRALELAAVEARDNGSLLRSMQRSVMPRAGHNFHFFADQLVARPSWNLFCGFGASYKTERDELSATRWNFASQLGVRLALNGRGSFVELAVRHWSNAGIRLPNRGQDFATMSFVFSPAQLGTFASAPTSAQQRTSEP